MARVRVPIGAASAAAMALGAALLAGCSGGGHEGYVAVGAGAPAASADAQPPEDGVVMVPLDGASASGRRGKPGPSPSDTSATSPRPSRPGKGEERGAAGHGASTSPGRAEPSPAPSARKRPPRDHQGPAHLTASAPRREGTDERWCETVTVTFANTGGLPVTSGTVTFGTHVIGPLGVDWGTVDTRRQIPVPLAAGAEREKTWEICVDAWRVPLGMHIETRDVALEWT